MSRERQPPSERGRLTPAEMEAIELGAWARRLGFDAFDDLERLEASIFGDQLGPSKPEPEEPIRVRQVDPSRRR